jgi:hypothetical protein
VIDSTSPAGTPAAGGPFAGIRRRVAAVAGRLVCDECGTELDADTERCPACAQRRRRHAGMESVVETYMGDRPGVNVERSDDADGTTGLDVESTEPEGWPW